MSRGIRDGYEMKPKDWLWLLLGFSAFAGALGLFFEVMR